MKRFGEDKGRGNLVGFGKKLCYFTLSLRGIWQICVKKAGVGLQIKRVFLRVGGK